MPESEEKTEQQQQRIELDVEVYQSLLDRIAELEKLAGGKSEEGEEDIDDIERLAKEGKQPVYQPQQSVPNLDEMSNTELAKFLLTQIDAVATPRLRDMETKVETLRVLREIDKCEAKYEDFWQYAKAVQEIGIANPSLSVEEAYHLAKSKTQVAKKSEERRPTITEKLLKLPPAPLGEKPGLSSSSTVETSPKSLRNAAMKAWEEVVGKGKVQI